jgi:hypothetical protein
MECRAFSRLRLHPDAPAVTLHNPLADRQANAGSGILFPAVQALEDNEYAVEILGVDSNAVIADGEETLI